MEAAFEALREQFRNFGTDGISLALTGFAVLFLVAEKERLDWHIGRLVKYEILFFLLLGNPFGYNNISSFWMQEDYAKIFMLLMPAVVIAVLVTELISAVKNFFTKVLCIAGCVCLIVVSMYFRFGEVKIQLLQNTYKVSEDIVELDTLLRSENPAITNMIAPREVCAQIRELNESVQLLYGEDLIRQMIDGKDVSEDEEEKEFYEACATIVAVPRAVDHQIDVAERYGSNCIVLRISDDDKPKMEEAGYTCFGKTDSYVVYLKD